MTGIKNLILAFTVLSASTAAFAGDDSALNLAQGKNADRERKSLTLNSFSSIREPHQDSIWGAPLSQRVASRGYAVAYADVSGFYNGIKLSQKHLMGHYDLS
ncbi:hypothetical protein QIW53_04405 [Pseudomonas fluorescens]|jgi:hypothetical protein|uniref:hypothetical protein n=1 Tax=Pseudomonas fluorescens TaxID=294 RepID=UPI003524803C